MLDNAETRALFSRLSHELSRQLVSLRAGFDLLLGDPARAILPDEHRQHLRTMIATCDEMLGLTRSYLDYAGLVQGSRPLRFGTYTLGALVREIDRQFATEAALRRLSWRCTLEGEDVTVTTDASRSQQIFGNLVANALKYTPEGGKVWVSARREGAWWRVTVADNGPGIPAEALLRVFEPFYRLPRDERGGIEGNGLGLAICREMVEQMDGQIDLDSDVGRGTQVTVRLPLQPAEPVWA